MATDTPSADRPTADAETLLSRCKRAACMPAEEPLVIRVTTDTGERVDYLAYFPGSMAVAEPIWFEYGENYETPHEQPESGVRQAVHLRWPDVELVAESDSLFMAGETDA